MKRLIATALCALAWLNLDAQVSPKDAVYFPSGYDIYYEHESRLLLGLLPLDERPQFSNIDFEKFFAEWEQWSELVAKGLLSVSIMTYSSNISAKTIRRISMTLNI